MASIVYALSSSADPTNVRYIGRTSTTPSRRLTEHLSNSKKRTTHLHNWIRKHIALGDSILITPLEDSLTFKQSKTREIHYISLYRGQGYDLTNATLGGEGTLGYKFTQEQRAKRMGNTNSLGRIRSPATRAKLSLAMTGNTNSLGNKLSPEHKIKLSLALMGKTNSLGAIHTPEQNLKNSLRNIGNTNSLGFKQSPEHIAKIVATRKRNRELRLAIESELAHDKKSTGD